MIYKGDAASVDEIWMFFVTKLGFQEIDLKNVVFIQLVLNTTQRWATAKTQQSYLGSVERREYVEKLNDHQLLKKYYPIAFFSVKIFLFFLFSNNLNS
jgi:hypothetical protein